MKKPKTKTTAHARGESQDCNNKKLAQAHSVPTVPGAKRDRPDPAPMAIQRLSLGRMKAKLGRMSGFGAKEAGMA
jgi:hypothetical protein